MYKFRARCIKTTQIEHNPLIEIGGLLRGNSHVFMLNLEGKALKSLTKLTIRLYSILFLSLLILFDIICHGKPTLPKP